MKTYVLLISKHFPATHTRAGDPTDFASFIKSGIKLHTIRGNYKLWAKCISEVQAGNAVLSLRQWTGKPYKSKQVEIMQLDKSSGVGVQSIFLNYPVCVIDGVQMENLNISLIALKDGLLLCDFREWFKGSFGDDKEKVIIHFTSFRYAN